MMKFFARDTKAVVPAQEAPRRAQVPARAPAPQEAPARRPAPPQDRAPPPRPRPAALPARVDDDIPSSFGKDDGPDDSAARRPTVSQLARRPAGAAIRFSSPDTTVRDPSPADILAISDYKGKIVSTALNERQKKVACLFEDGTMLVHKPEAASSSVLNARSLLQAEQHRIRHIVHVDLKVIREAYEAHDRRSNESPSRGRDRDSASMVKAVLALVREAHQMRSSDIHVDVKTHEAQIRVRSDGMMAHMRDLPSDTAHDLCQAAFNMADASDPSYKLFEFQGARITSVKQPLPEGIQAIRLQFNPLSDGGRHLVMRLLPTQKEGSDKDVDDLGYAARHVRQIRRMRDKPNGINVISGPTGSGKSTTLQRSLIATMREKNHEVSVITVEDPPEYEIPGAIQLPVTNAKTADDRAEAFRQAIVASLRSDPDIIMIGEVRDQASGQLAFQAAMTGHQVWCSLHANDAISILGRMLDLRIEPWKLQDPGLVTGLTGQRLVRRLCTDCALSWADAEGKGLLDPEAAAFMCEAVGDVRKVARFANPEGCGKCQGKAYLGRSVVAETITPDQGFMDALAAHGKPRAATYWIEKLDGITMVEHAVSKMFRGEVDMRDVRSKVGLVEDCHPGRLAEVRRMVADGRL